jgi:hypothetical protein
MANLAVKNSAGDTKYMKTAGAGSDGDPHIPEHTVSGTVAVTDNAGSLTVDNGGTFAVQVDGAALTALQKIDDMISGSEAQVDVVAALPAGDNNIGNVDVASALPAGDNNIGNVDIASALPAGTNFIGASAPSTVTVDVTLSLDTNAYTAGDVLAATQEVAGAARANGAGVELVSMLVRDKDDQTAAAMTFYFFNANTTLGTENSAPDIDDTEIDTLIGMVTIPAAAWLDLGGVKVANMSNIGLLMHPGAASTSLYIAATTAGTPTQSASGITVTLQFIRY